MAADFRHEQEKMAWGRLEKTSAFRFVVDAYQEVSNDLRIFAAMKGRNFPVTRETAPQLYRLYRLAAERVGVTAPVPVYLQMEYGLQAQIVGTDGDCAILVDSACIEQFSDTQLLALFGHVLSHIRYGHVRMLNIDAMSDTLLRWIPLGGGVAAEGFKATLLQWRKFADYTADRGAAIAAGTADAVLRNLSQSLGRDLDSQGIQAAVRMLPDEKQLELGAIGTTVFQLMSNTIRVPYGVWRMKALKQWCASEDCRREFPGVYYGTGSEFGLERMTDGAALYRQFRVMRTSNLERALALLHAAAACREPRARTELGQYYLNGTGGLKQDSQNGLQLLREAALQGDPEAWYTLAGCFDTGCGKLLRKDPQQAAWLYRLAAAAGHREAATKVRDKVFTISPKSMVDLMNWFTANYRGGPAVLNEMTPAMGLDMDCCPDLNALRTYLWIPGNEAVYLAEYDVDQQGNFRRAIAIAGSGVYVFDNQGLPFRLSWEALKTCKIDAQQRGEIITLRLNEKPLCSYKKNPPERAVGVMLVKIRTTLNQRVKA